MSPRWLLVALGLLLAGCSGAQVARGVQIACKVDAVTQPVLVTLAPGAGGDAVLAATLDQQLVHPLVVAACVGVGGAAVGVVPTS